MITLNEKYCTIIQRWSTAAWDADEAAEAAIRNLHASQVFRGPGRGAKIRRERRIARCLSGARKITELRKSDIEFMGQRADIKAAVGL
jgi:hypothetical protein